MPCPFLSNADLRPKHVPGPVTVDGEINDFAHTFDGYEAYGSFEACAAIANGRRHGSLTQLRACLFFDFRADRHGGPPYKDERDPCRLWLLERIRARILARGRLASSEDHAPSPRSYWVLPGLLLAGAYPGASDLEAHQNRLRALFNAGCRTFISLMQEREVDQAGRAFRPYLPELRTMAEEAGEEVTFLRFPVADLGVPSEERVGSILDAIDLSRAAGRPIYLQCFGGVGRTGTVVARWMLRHGHADADSVLDRLALLRQADRLAAHRPAPETEEQRSFAAATGQSS